MVGTALREYNNDDRASEPRPVYQERQFLANERHAAPISLEAANIVQAGHPAKYYSASTRLVLELANALLECFYYMVRYTVTELSRNDKQKTQSDMLHEIEGINGLKIK
jgi:hypothetical protein